MEVVRAQNTGFCFGVKRAVEMVLRERRKRSGSIYTLGPIIHNPQMVAKLAEQGIIPINDVHAIKEGAVVLRTHGVMKEEEEHIRASGLFVIDATCPFVKRVRTRAIHLEKEGYRVVVAGDSNHPEVKSVLSYLNDGGIVLQDSASLSATKVGLVSQTTLDKETFTRVVEGLIEGVGELRVYNTICESTEIRQKEVAALSLSVEIMLIVGGRSSSNTTKLYSIAKKVQPRTFQIETEAEIMPEWFVGLRKVGLAGGASTPPDIIDLVERRVINF